MNVVVCVKQIPDPAAPGALKPDTHTLDRSGKLIMDDSDNYGVEMALQLAGGEGDEVTLVSMAPGGETSGLRTGLAMGAAKAILVSDDALAGSDALGTAKVLAAAITRANPDLVVMATESTDGYTGTLPVQVAELMGLPSVTFAKAISVDGSSIKVERQTEAGYDEVVVPMPALVTVTAGVVEPRYPSFKGIMAAKSKPVDNLTVADLGIDASQVGAAGAGQEITDVSDGRGAFGGRDRGGRGRRRAARRGLPRAAEGGLRMAIDKIWVLAESVDGAPTPVTLELLTEARTVGSTVEAVAWGGDVASLAGPLGEYGATTIYDVGDVGDVLPGVPVAAAIAALVQGGNAPDVILFPATYEGRDIAGRLSARLDKPVLTNVTGLVASDGGLSSQHPAFGGNLIVTAKFTGDGPGSSSSGPSRSPPSPRAARRLRSRRRRCPTWRRRIRPRWSSATWRSAAGRSSTRRRSSSRVGGVWARRPTTH